MCSNGCRTVLLLTPPVLLLFSFTAIATILERVSKSIFNNNVWRGYSNGESQVSLSRPAYAVALVSGAGIWQLRRTEGTAGHERRWVWNVLLSNLVLGAGSLAIFGYATAAEMDDESWRSYRDAGDAGQEHTREAWACQINEFFPGKGWAASVCETAKAMRFFLLPMAVAAPAVLGSLWVLVRSRGGVKLVFGGKGRYAGFRSAYEMQPQGTESPYAGPPAGQWVQQPWAVQPGQQWQGQQGQQWAMQPYQQWGPQTVVQAPPKLDTPVFR